MASLREVPIFQESGSRPWAALTSCEFGSWETYPQGNESISHLGKRNIIDSKVTWCPGYVIVPTRVKDQKRSAICFSGNFVSCIALISVFLFHVKRLSRSWHPLRSLWPGEWKQSFALCCQDFQLALKQAFESFLNKVCCKLPGWKKRHFIAFLVRWGGDGREALNFFDSWSWWRLTCCWRQYNQYH